MFIIPKEAKLYLTYPQHKIITVYGKVGELVATFKFSDLDTLKKVEKILYNTLLKANCNISERKRKMKINQFSLKKKLIKTWSYEDILDSDFSYEAIRRCNTGSLDHHKGYLWEIEEKIPC